MILPRVLILGSKGMLGHVVDRYLTVNSRFTVFNTLRSRANSNFNKFYFDVDKFEILDRIILETKVNFVINCIGIIKPYIDEKNETKIFDAIKINSMFPHLLTELAQKRKFKIIQIATDCVYSGSLGNYYESSKHDALDIYGKTKSIGEPISEQVLNLRTSIVGKEKKANLSLFEWFLNQKPQSTVYGFTNHFWNGVTTLAFAQIIEGVILKSQNLHGTFHILPSDKLSKFEILNLLKKYGRRDDIKVVPYSDEKIIDRTLNTLNPLQNQNFWDNAGFKNIPTIEELIKNFFYWY